MSLLNDGKRILKEAFPFILIINALIILLSLFTSITNKIDTSELLEGVINTGTLFLFLFVIAIFLCKLTIYCGITLKLYRGKEVKITDILPTNKTIFKSLKVLWFVILTFLCSIILIMPLTILSIIITSIILPELSKIVYFAVIILLTIYLMFKFFFIGHVAIFNNKGFFKSLKESSSLMKGRKFAFSKAFSVVFLIGFVAGFVGGFLNGILSLDEQRAGLLKYIAQNLISDISMILTCVIMLNMARDERVIEEYN